MNEIMKPEAGMTATQGFSGQTLAVSGETMAQVLAARQKAEVEARFIVAMERPRNWETVRHALLADCKRPGFAGHAVEKIWGAGWYRKPIGQGVEGFSIRFAEACIRAMGHIDARSSIIWEGERERLIQVDVVDIEKNISIPTTICVEKTVERKRLKARQKPISVRTNSYGDPVYKVEATEDETLGKQNSAISKAIRNAVLRLVPGDIQGECRELILKIRDGAIIDDPIAYRRKIVDAFAKMGVTPDDLKEYLQHNVDSSSPAELAVLRDLHKEIEQGKTTFTEVMVAVRAERGEKEPDKDEKSAMDEVKDRLKAKAKDKEKK
jgi:hypothetical protein